MSLGILGKKVGMTRVYDEDGAMIPVTVIDVSGNTLLQKRTKETDGYVAVQVGYDTQKESRVTKARSGHFNKHKSEAKRLLPDKNYIGFSLTQGNVYREKSWSINNFIDLATKISEKNNSPQNKVHKI